MPGYGFFVRKLPNGSKFEIITRYKNVTIGMRTVVYRNSSNLSTESGGILGESGTIWGQACMFWITQYVVYYWTKIKVQSEKYQRA